MLFACLVLYSEWQKSHSEQVVYPRLVHALISTGTVVLAPPILLGLILLAVIVVVGSATWLFGLGGPVTALFYEVTVESAPLGQWSVLQLSGPERPGIEASLDWEFPLPASFGLTPQHSAVYEDPDALAALKAWLESLTAGNSSSV
jgi:hypothetical protein